MSAGKFVGEAAVAAVLRLNPFGPEGYERRARNRAYRKARRKAKRGETLTEDEYELLRSTKETVMLDGKLTHTGAGIAASSPLVGILVNAFVPHVENAIVNIGFAPAVCAPEAVNCISAGQLAVVLIAGTLSMIGGAIASYGRKRAEKKHAAELAAATAK